MSTKAIKGKIDEIPTTRGKEVMARIMSSLQRVKTETQTAKLNEHSMEDNNGGRIIYTLTDSEVVVVNGKKIIIVNIKK